MMWRWIGLAFLFLIYIFCFRGCAMLVWGFFHPPCVSWGGC
jgi:hypothetical protein